MSNKVNINYEIDPKQWKQFQNKFPDLNDTELLAKLLEEYTLLSSGDSEIGNLVTELDEQKKLSESLRKKCKNFALRVKELEDIQADQDNDIQKLNKQLKKLSKDFPGSAGEEHVKEKIVYKEDTKTINELKEKRDALQKNLWEKKHIMPSQKIM